MKKSTKKGLIIIAIIVILITAAVPISIRGYNSYEYNKYYKQALSDIKKDNLEEALNNLSKALVHEPKHKEEVNKELTLIGIVMESKDNYNNGLLLLKDKKYMDAIAMFIKVAEEDTFRYKMTKDWIAECKDLFIKENLENAKGKANNKEFSEGIKYLDSIINIYSDNGEALKLKNDYLALMQNQKKEATAKKASPGAVKPQNPVDTQANIGLITPREGTLVVNDNGKTIYFEFSESSLMKSVTFFINAIPADPKELNNQDVINSLVFDYSIKFHADGKETIVNGKSKYGGLTDATASFDFDSAELKGTADISITFKGKVYTLTRPFICKATF